MKSTRKVKRQKAHSVHPGRYGNVEQEESEDFFAGHTRPRSSSSERKPRRSKTKSAEPEVIIDPETSTATRYAILGFVAGVMFSLFLFGGTDLDDE